MTEAELLDMLRSGRTQESSLVERKPDGFKDREARKTVVAFANSVPEGQEAVLFIGVHDKTGELLGVANADELQRKYSKVLAECYPSITYQMHALTISGRTAVAIVVPSSARRPHFAGGAYVRSGAQSVVASDEMYDELIISRNDKTRELLKYKHGFTILSVRGINYHLGSNKPFSGGGHVEGCECQVRSCDSFRVTLYNIASQVSFTESLQRVSISFDDKNNRPMLLVTAPGR